jgi:glutathionylspermidine synthase
MQRHRCTPRPAWREKVSEVGLTYHSHESGPYWDESAAYEFTAAEVETLETAARELHRLCIAAAEHVITHDGWDRLCIPAASRPAILRSWERDDFSLYGRFDLAFDGRGPPKLLEYNADTPTALVEAAVAQWFWLQEARPGADQFNSLHERLIAAWSRWRGHTIHFSSIKDSPEDEQTVVYLRDTCEQAGVSTRRCTSRTSAGTHGPGTSSTSTARASRTASNCTRGNGSGPRSSRRILPATRCSSSSPRGRCC